MLSETTLFSIFNRLGTYYWEFAIKQFSEILKDFCYYCVFCARNSGYCCFWQTSYISSELKNSVCNSLVNIQLSVEKFFKYLSVLT